MSVTEAVLSRRSCRQFLSTPVPAEKVRRILETARQSPSGGNVQPWHLYVLGGEPLARLRAAIQAKLPEYPRGEGSEYNIYPPNIKEPYKSRVFKCGEDLYATIGVKREEKPRRLAQFARNFDFFGAPLAMFFAIDRQMGNDQWADMGIFLQTVMLLAREYGLHTCPQEAWAVWYKTVGEFLRFAPELMLYCGLAVGYCEESAPINSLRTERASLADIATFLGV